MSNMVLYRKYRPKSFSEVIGQEHVVQTLTNAIKEDVVSHAYLFAGPRGSGKTTIARLLAKAVNCENRKDAEPCNKCSSCLEINQGKAIDLIEIDAASNRGIDEVRSLREGIKFSPTRLKYKVFIIDECHQLSKDAANALLKMLEEPPSHAIFILATTEIHKMIPTIISRCQRFDFRRLSFPEISKKLKKIIKNEKSKVDDAVLDLIASNSEGSIRDAESLLDQVLTYANVLEKESVKIEDVEKLLGLVDVNIVSKLVDFIQKKDKEASLDFLDKTLKKGRDPGELAKALVNYLRGIMIMKISSEIENPLIAGLGKEEKEKAVIQSNYFKLEDLQRMLKSFMEAEERIKYSSIPQLPLELSIIDSCQEK
jgi:DNA polymerase III subunit gamma/tau